jgi:hypothetical protein
VHTKAADAAAQALARQIALDPDDPEAATMRLIREMTKQCPSCHVPILKVR